MTLRHRSAENMSTRERLPHIDSSQSLDGSQNQRFQSNLIWKQTNQTSSDEELLPTDKLIPEDALENPAEDYLINQFNIERETLFVDGEGTTCVDTEEIALCRDQMPTSCDREMDHICEESSQGNSSDSKKQGTNDLDEANSPCSCQIRPDHEKEPLSVKGDKAISCDCSSQSQDDQLICPVCVESDLRKTTNFFTEAVDNLQLQLWFSALLVIILLIQLANILPGIVGPSEPSALFNIFGCLLVI